MFSSSSGSNLSLYFFFFGILKINWNKPGVIAHVCNTNTLEAETGGSPVWACLGYIVRPCHKKTKPNQNNSKKD
jgi:hypothetical protein